MSDSAAAMVQDPGSWANGSASVLVTEQKNTKTFYKLCMREVGPMQLSGKQQQVIVLKC
jgi:hypothetical protein